jgi:hypothetical protein
LIDAVKPADATVSAVTGVNTWSRQLRAVLRSVVPAVLIVSAVVCLAVTLNRRPAAPTEPDRPWTPSPEYVQRAELALPNGQVVSLWSDRTEPPTLSGSWYLATARNGRINLAFGWAGAPSERPWVSLDFGVLAGGVAEETARWVRIGGNPLIPVMQGVFLTTERPLDRIVSVEVLDDNYDRLAFFDDVSVSGRCCN